MSKVKTCKFLNSNQEGAVIFIDRNCNVCYDGGINITQVADYKNINIDEILQKRKEFIESMRRGEQQKCENCHQLIEIEENDIDLEKISWLNVASYTTCSLRCKYCYFNDEQLSAKMSDETKYLLPVVKQFHEKGVLTDRIMLAVAGGEPLLFEDLAETLDFLCKNYKHPRFNFQSNSTLTPQVKKVTEILKNANMPLKNLYTSIDAGTKETFEKIRGRDMFEKVKENILYYAKNNCLTDIQLKYIFLNNKEKDMYNISNEDIYGFCDFVKEVKNSTKSNVVMILERDLYDGRSDLAPDIKEAIIKTATFALKNGISYIFSPCGYINMQDRKIITQEATKRMYNVKVLSGENNNFVPLESISNINLNITIEGSNNTIKLGKIRGISKECSSLNINIRANNSLIDIGDLFIENALNIQCGRTWGELSDNVEIKIDSPCTIKDVKIFACNNNSKTIIEKHCMFDSNVYIANADEHPIYDRDTKKIINKGKLLKIGLHSWIRDNVSILKNVQLMDNTMVELGSVVTKSFKENRCLIAGNPAEIIKCNVDWSRDNEEFLN